MAEELKPKMEMPVALGLTVLVCEVRTGGVLHPLTRYDQAPGKPMQVASGSRHAPRGLDVLREALQLCAATCQGMQWDRYEQQKEGTDKTDRIDGPEAGKEGA
jgi:hypothetical protein